MTRLPNTSPKLPADCARRSVVPVYIASGRRLGFLI
jgi:hypothetical protein